MFFYILIIIVFLFVLWFIWVMVLWLVGWYYKNNKYLKFEFCFIGIIMVLGVWGVVMLVGVFLILYMFDNGSDFLECFLIIFLVVGVILLILVVVSIFLFFIVKIEKVLKKFECNIKEVKVCIKVYKVVI